jgi:pyroglutamyl-peptidase
MRLMVQGFMPFGAYDRNPSQELVEALAARRTGGQVVATSRIVTAVLPTSYATVSETVPALMTAERPDVWIGVGLAAGRPSLSVEAVAVNHVGSADPAADGAVVRSASVRVGGPAAYLSTLPLEAIVAAWREAGIPGYVSMTAGTYLCNMAFYLAASRAAQLGLDCRVGFLHLPLLPEQVTDPDAQPSMARELQLAGLDSLLEVVRG